MIAIFFMFSGNRLTAEPVTIAVMGDSLVHGYGLPAQDGFVPQLDSWLKANRLDAIVINAGVSGDTTAGGLARIDWTLEPDVDGLIVSLGGNDALRGIDPGLTQKNLDGILAIAGARQIPVLLVGIGAPNNYGPDYSEQFNAIFPQLSIKYSTLIYHNFLQALTRLPDRAAVLQTYFQADAIHPNAAGVLLIIDDIGPSVADLIQRIADR